MSPVGTELLTQVLSGAVIFFIVAYIGNRISFSNRFVNALVTGLVFALFYGALAYTLDKSSIMPPELRQASQKAWLQLIAMSAALVFVIDLVANMLSFSSRIMNALMAAVLFAVLFAFLIYATGVPTTST